MINLSISFEVFNNELLLCYSPEMGIEYIQDKFKNNDEVHIKHTFVVNSKHLRTEDDYLEEVKFCIGTVEGSYIHLDSEVIGTDHEFYFSINIKLNMNMFLAYRNISILSKIDKIVERDFYVGGDWEKHRGISHKAYLELIDKFPKTAELNKYANYRISNILREYYPECDRYEKIYKKYMENPKLLSLNVDNTTNYNQKIEYEQFKEAYQELKILLQDVGIKESVWQAKIHNILRLLYPQYIYAAREVAFQGVDKHDKRPDFLLVNVNGFVDVLEIKKPDVQLLREYRNNFVPSSEFAGSIQQIEKYIYCLNTSEKAKSQSRNALHKKGVPENFEIKFLNPQGLLLLGRSKGLTKQQQEDFELIKRQYKHLVDIMTYDDLLNRIRNIIHGLSIHQI